MKWGGAHKMHARCPGEEIWANCCSSKTHFDYFGRQRTVASYNHCHSALPGWFTLESGIEPTPLGGKPGLIILSYRDPYNRCTKLAPCLTRKVYRNLRASTI